MKLVLSSLIIIFLVSCQAKSIDNDNHTNSPETTEQVKNESNTITNDSATVMNEDLIINDETESSEKINTNKNKKRTKEIIPYTRFTSQPGDANFNGEPLVHQIEISAKIISAIPDTLSRLAMSNYMSYKYFFPKSIACNFDEGTSTEHVDYPKRLIFQFQVFENEFQAKPYIIQNVVVKRNSNGELTVE